MPRFTALNIQEWLKRMGAPGNGAALDPLAVPSPEIPLQLQRVATEQMPVSTLPRISPDEKYVPQLPYETEALRALPPEAQLPRQLPQPRLAPVMQEEVETLREPAVPYQWATGLPPIPPPPDPIPEPAAPDISPIDLGGRSVVEPDFGPSPPLPIFGSEEGVTTPSVPIEPPGFLSKIGDFFKRPGVGAGMTAAGAKMMEAASQPGASVLGSLGAGIGAAQELGMERGAAELDRQKAAQDAAYKQSQIYKNLREGQEPGQEITGRQRTLQQIGDQRGTDPALLAQYVGMATTEEGFEYALGQIAPDAAGEATTEFRNVQHLQEARNLVAQLEAEGVPADDPRMVDAVANENVWNRRMQMTQLPQQVAPTADIRNWERYSALKLQEDPNWVPTAAEYQSFQTEQPSQYGGRQPSRGQKVAETRRLKDYDDWFLQGRGAQFKKNFDTFNEVLFDLDQRIATQEIEASSDWDKDDGSGFFQAMKGALVQRMPFMASALTPEDTNTLDLVRAVVFQSLKETLGGQFAEREAENLVRAAYNPMLPPEVNRSRIQRLMTELRSTDHYMKSMGEYYERTGELAFYTHQNATDAWDLAVQTGELEGLGSSIVNPLEYGGLSDKVRAEAMAYDLGELTPEERGELAYKLSGGQPYGNLEVTLNPMAYEMIVAIREMEMGR
jgi:hypothetical protein